MQLKFKIFSIPVRFSKQKQFNQKLKIMWKEVRECLFIQCTEKLTSTGQLLNREVFFHCFSTKNHTDFVQSRHNMLEKDGWQRWNLLKDSRGESVLLICNEKYHSKPLTAVTSLTLMTFVFKKKNNKSNKTTDFVNRTIQKSPSCTLEKYAMLSKM